MAPNVWIHCNKCFIRLIDHPQEFCFTQCGHVMCSKCSQHSMAQKICLVCGQLVRLLPMNKKLPSDISSYFMPMDKVWNIQKFQIENMEKLIKSYAQKYNNAKREFIRLKEAYQQEKAEKIHYKQLSESRKQSNPTFPSNFSDGMTIPFSAETSINMSNPINANMGIRSHQSNLSHFQPNYSRARTSGSDRSNGAASMLSLSQVFVNRNHL